MHVYTNLRQVPLRVDHGEVHNACAHVSLALQHASHSLRRLCMYVYILHTHIHMYNSIYFYANAPACVCVYMFFIYTQTQIRMI